MDVTACIVGFRNVDDVVACVAALGRQTHRPLSVVICENGGAGVAEALRAALPRRLLDGGTVTILPPGGNLGYAGGFNACVAASRQADAWWLVNPDCQPEPGALAAMLTRLGQGDCQAVGATVCRADGSVQGHGGRFRAWLARAESIGHGSAPVPAPDPSGVEAAMNYILGACMLVDRDFWQAVGPMREDYFLYAEEVEWCLRAQARGMRLGFAADALIRHDQGSTTGSAKDVAHRPWLPVYLDERNKLHVVRDTQPFLLPVAAATSLVLIAMRYARRGAWRQTGDALAGWAAGLANRRGVPARLLRG